MKNVIKKSAMKNVTNKLGLPDNADERSIIAAIESIRNEKKDAEQFAAQYKAEKEKLEAQQQAELDELKKKYDQLEQEKNDVEVEKTKAEARQMAELEELQKKYDQLEKEKNDAEGEKAKAEESEKNEKCKNMLEGFVKVGRIANEALPAWQETAKLLGIDKVKNLIEELPLNKKAQTIAVEDVRETDEQPTTTVNYMAKVQAKNKKD